MIIEQSDRIAGLLYGSLIADSLALGAHWIYDQEKLTREFGRVSELLAPRTDSYHPTKQRGEQTHVGDQALTLLHSLDTQGGFDLEGFSADWQKMWEGYGDYFDHATKETLANFAKGVSFDCAASDSNELSGAARIAPLLAAMAGKSLDEAVAVAQAQTTLTHSSPLVADTAEFLTRIIWPVLQGETLSSAIQLAADATYAELDAQSLLTQVESVSSLSINAGAKSLGLACPIPQALPTLLLLLERSGDDFETALIDNVMAGGDNAARGLALGMILGAYHGKSLIPTRWLDGLQAAPQVKAFLQGS